MALPKFLSSTELSNVKRKIKSFIGSKCKEVLNKTQRK